MKCAIGIDAVCIERFNSWHLFDDKQLARIFAPEEIMYARSQQKLFAQRLAARFAAKEAFLKALQQLVPNIRLHLFSVAHAVSVIKRKNGAPHLLIMWDKLSVSIDPSTVASSVSLTHTNCCAYASVLLTQN